MSTTLSPSTLSSQELARAFNDQAPSDPADVVAARAISSLTDSFVRTIAVDLLTREVEQLRRGEARHVERIATSPAVVRAQVRSEVRRERIEALTSIVLGVRLDLSSKFLSTKFKVDGQEVTWGAATVEQHTRRIEALAVQAAGLQDTIARHQAAIAMIEEASGARSLGDL